MAGPIVVSLDTSPLSERALPIAVAIAREGGYPLHLVSVNEPPQLSPGGSAIGVGTLEGIYEPLWSVEKGEGQQAYLDRVAGEIREAEGIAVQAVVVDGLASDALVAHAREAGASLLVMATHGRGGLSRAWLGSTTDQVLRHSTTPMVVVRGPEEDEEDAGAAPGRELPRSVMIPLDGSRLAEQVLGPVEALGRALGWEYHLVRVVPVPYVIGSPAMVHSLRVDEERLEAQTAEARNYLAEVEARLQESGGVVRTTRVVEGGGSALADAILDTARELEVELLALATHGRGGVKRMVLGSVADKLIRASDVPLLVVRPQEAGE
ncbi:MAG TPA: universal stress protein [Longimicrobiales bacterium]|nr:universal stress protein [Longimicrobiales bacterium]